MSEIRSSKPEVRNPVLGLPAAQKLLSLPPETREALRAILLEMRQDAQGKADYCWRKHKAPMAAYWKAVAVYSGHIAKVLR